MLQIKLFAKAREVVGSPQIQIPWTNGQSVLRLKDDLAGAYPDLSPLIPRLLVSVNQDYADDRTEIRVSDEVACFPPVSGG